MWMCKGIQTSLGLRSGFWGGSLLWGSWALIGKRVYFVLSCKPVRAKSRSSVCGQQVDKALLPANFEDQERWSAKRVETHFVWTLPEEKKAHVCGRCFASWEFFREKNVGNINYILWEVLRFLGSFSNQKGSSCISNVKLALSRKNVGKVKFVFRVWEVFRPNHWTAFRLKNLWRRPNLKCVLFSVRGGGFGPKLGKSKRGLTNGGLSPKCSEKIGQKSFRENRAFSGPIGAFSGPIGAFSGLIGTDSSAPHSRGEPAEIPPKGPFFAQLAPFGLRPPLLSPPLDFPNKSVEGRFVWDNPRNEAYLWKWVIIQESHIDPRPWYFWKVSRYTSHFYRDTFAKVCPPLGRT